LLKLSFCINICPISDPYKRHMYLIKSNHPKRDEMIENQLKHFGSERNMRQAAKQVNPIVVSSSEITNAYYSG